jgi:hypothetical protein
VVDKLYVSVLMDHHVVVEQACSKGKDITALTGNYLNRQLFYETAIKTPQKIVIST